MIRRATLHDKADVIALMKDFRSESPIAHVYGEDDEAYWVQLLSNIFAGQGAIFYAEGKGLLMSMILPSVWSPKVLALHEMAWYVRPDFRNGTIGYRLFKEYVEFGKALKDQGRIKYFTVSKMISSPALKYDKYGFRKIDENWIQ